MDQQSPRIGADSSSPRHIRRLHSHSGNRASSSGTVLAGLSSVLLPGLQQKLLHTTQSPVGAHACSQIHRPRSAGSHTLIMPRLSDEASSFCELYFIGPGGHGSATMSRTMADWRQIQARIRKAKNSPDAYTLQTFRELYQRTRDAMVACRNSARLKEKNGPTRKLAVGTLISAQRFRRADWKKKAEEALARLGIELPAPGAEPPPAPLPQQSRSAAREETESVVQLPVVGEISRPFDR